ncbi:MAG: thioredoxin domain-containing protein [Anaerolineae bacterium]|nr:thioredoxin domain-containing protein [Anaerolineae bacterium]
MTNRNESSARQQQIVLVVIVAIVAVLAVVLIVVSMLANTPTPAPAVAANDTSETPADAATGEGDSAAPTAVEVVESGISDSLYDGLERGLVDGMPALGPADAPVVIRNYSAFSCSHCANFHDDQFVSLLDDVRAGDVRFVFVPVINQSTAAATAGAFCADEQGAFWEMHDLLYANVRVYGYGAFTLEALQADAESLGLDMDTFNTCLVEETADGAAIAEPVLNRLYDAAQLWDDLVVAYTTADGTYEVTGTPTFTFNGEAIDWTGDGRRSGSVSIDMIREQIAARM